MSKRVVSLICQMALVMSLGANSAAAHHSFAMYDSDKLIKLAGTVKEFQWTNPHVILWFVTEAAAGQEGELWTIELPTSTGNLARMDWSKKSLVPGDQVVVEFNPLRDGRHGGSFKQLTISATGKVLIARAPAKPDADPTSSTPQAAAATSANGVAPAPSASVAAKAAALDNGQPAAPSQSKSQGCACVTPSHRALTWPAALWLCAVAASASYRYRSRRATPAK